jgi:hypothetical protein
MHEAPPVRVIERVGQFQPVAQRLLRLQRTAQKTIGKRLPLEELHDEEADRLGFQG